MRLYLSVRDNTWYNAKIVNPFLVLLHALYPPPFFSPYLEMVVTPKSPLTSKIITTFHDHHHSGKFPSTGGENQEHDALL